MKIVLAQDLLMNAKPALSMLDGRVAIKEHGTYETDYRDHQTFQAG